MVKSGRSATVNIVLKLAAKYSPVGGFMFYDSNICLFTLSHKYTLHTKYTACI